MHSCTLSKLYVFEVPQVAQLILRVRHQSYLYLQQTLKSDLDDKLYSVCSTLVSQGFVKVDLPRGHGWNPSEFQYCPWRTIDTNGKKTCLSTFLGDMSPYLHNPYC